MRTWSSPEMSCPSCRTNNPDGAKFCMSCGTALGSACPACGAELPTAGAAGAAEAKFCPSCGHQLDRDEAEAQAGRLARFIPPELQAKLATARAGGGMQGERRIVTMLFCDVTGSTAAAQNLDPEEWAEIMNGAFEHLIAPVYRYEGTLARLMGDAILAFFGAPIGHEDDPERAVLAGLDILASIAPYRAQVKERWGFDFDVRVGINTGLVVVGEVGSDLRLEYSALGDAVNMAARMEQTATPGTVQITEQTHKLVAPLFDFEDLGGIEVKGHDEPVHAFQVVGVKAAPGQLRGVEGLESPLVGRAHEVAQLEEAVGALTRGQGRIVSVTGDAGLGKSRLVAEIRRDTLAREPDVRWLEGRSLSYDASTPYAPIIDLLSGYFQLGADHANGGHYGAVRDGIERVMPDAVDQTAPFIATMLGVQIAEPDMDRVRYLDPPSMRDGIFNAACALLEHLAADRPTVVMMEDLHWSDSTSLELLEHLMPLTQRSPLLLLALFRPQRQDPSWRFHEVAEREYEHLYTAVRLEPLSADGSRELIANLLRIEGLTENIRSLILAKAEGNPFFVEEVIRSLLDSGVVVPDGDHWRATREIADIAVPDTLSAVLTTRMDRLDDASKQVVQAASVIGREFSFDALTALGGAGPE
ncbi:MAG: AAA family ATPase, partial [Chloroflexi bacterium]|nr:AAA family ATPase [Chloroflexota bacterium]